jgi:hypothetical protein
MNTAMGTQERAMNRADDGGHEWATEWSMDWDTPVERVDWAASCRLALVVSIVAALLALALVTVVGETAAIVMVIVAATATSWFHLEQGQLTRPATVRAGKFRD